MSLITTTSDLERFCATLKGAEYITVDTEFLRDATYYPLLCLLQIGGPGGCAAIDPLAKDIDLASVREVLLDKSIIKVFHSCRQDMEILLPILGGIPTPLFDTQVAAMVCGFGESASYASLAEKLAGVKLDKSSQFTDWSKRPLSTKQLTYALGDVLYLKTVYEKLRDQLASSGREEWVAEDIAALTNPENYTVSAQNAWKRLNLRSHSPRFVTIVKEVAAWREMLAQQRDVPRSRVLKDSVIVEIASRRPKTEEDLRAIPHMNRKLANDAGGRQLLEIVAGVMDMQREELMEPDRSPVYTKKGSLMEQLKLLLKHQCKQHGVAEKMIATTSDLAHIAGEANPSVLAMTGWRYTIFGQYAEQVKAGTLCIKVENGEVVMRQSTDH